MLRELVQHQVCRAGVGGVSWVPHGAPAPAPVPATVFALIPASFPGSYCGFSVLSPLPSPQVFFCKTKYDPADIILLCSPPRDPKGQCLADSYYCYYDLFCYFGFYS